MVMRAVESKRSRTVEEKRSNGSPLQVLVNCLNSNFTTRHRATIDVYGGQKNFKNMANVIKSADSMLKANNAEVTVLQSFLYNSGLITPEDRKNGFAARFLQESLMTWITCESLYTNIKQLSFRTNRCYFLDDSYITLNEDQVLNYYRGYKLLWPEVWLWKNERKIHLICSLTTNELGSKFYRNRLTFKILQRQHDLKLRCELNSLGQKLPSS